MNSLVVRPAAEADLQEAYNWYEQRQKGLGTEFLDCVQEAFEKITQKPDLGFLVHKTMRRARVRRFPYGVFYLVDGSTIIVVAVMHGRRSPRQWKSRRE
jgi:toxin ParE1/3/4